VVETSTNSRPWWGQTVVASPKFINELTAVTSLSAGAAVAVFQDGTTLRATPAQFITQAESFVQSGSGASSRTVQQELRERFSVTQFGAVGDGTTDDTTAFTNAIASNRELYIARGMTFIVGDVVKEDISNFRMYGGGIIKRKAAASKIITFGDDDGVTQAKNIILEGLRVDANAVGSFGGINFYNAENVWVHRCHFFDSGATGTGASDKYAVVFGSATGATNKRVVVTENLVEDLQLEVDKGLNVVISKNIVLRGYRTGAISCVAIADGDTLKDYVITDNVIVDPFTKGILVGTDVGDDNVTVENFTIKGNQIIKRSVAGAEGIVVGDVGAGTPVGTTIKNVVVEGNTVSVDTSLTYDAAGILVQASTGTTSQIQKCAVRGNHVSMRGATLGTSSEGIALRRLTDCDISGNSIHGAYTGMGAGDLARCEIANNTVRGTGNTAYSVTGPSYCDIHNNISREGTGTGFSIASSGGNNSVWDNKVFDSPATKFAFTPASTDYFEHILTGSATVDPASIADGEGLNTDITVTGAAVGDYAEVAIGVILQGLIATCWVNDVDTVRVRLQNETGGAIDLASSTWRVKVTKRHG